MADISLAFCDIFLNHTNPGCIQDMLQAVQLTKDKKTNSASQDKLPAGPLTGHMQHAASSPCMGLPSGTNAIGVMLDRIQ